MKCFATLPCFAAFVVLSNSPCLAFTDSIHHSLVLRSPSSPWKIAIVPYSPTDSHAPPSTFFRRRAITSAKSSGDEPSSETRSTTPTLWALSMIAIPVASLIFPNLLQLVRALPPPNSSEQLAAVTALFVYNRFYLYAMAATIVGLAASRGSTDAPQLGRRITDLTEELLYRPTLQKKLDNQSSAMEVTAEPTEIKPLLIQSFAESGLENSLDQISTETQALLLPLVVSFLLALSIFLLPFWNGAPSFVTENGEVGSAFQAFLAQVFPSVSQLWNVGILALFTRSEVRRLGFELKWLPDSAAFEWATAFTVTGLACFAQMWPAQNFVNMALAILVARAIQLDSFTAIVGALSLLMAYDATSVFLIPAAGASEIVGPHNEALASTTLNLASESAAAGSAMGSVAIQKLTSGIFAPGLLTTKIGNGLGGALGLGDAVFPSLMASFAKRFDDSQAKSNEGTIPMFDVTMAGYVLGCLACEFAPLISTSGLPALVFIVPSMLGSLVLVSAMTGRFQDLVAYDPKEKAREA